MIRFHRNEIIQSPVIDCRLLGIIFLLSPLVADGQAFRVFAVSDMIRVFEDGIKP